PPANAVTAAAAAPIANDSMKKRTGVKTSARAKATTAISQIQRQVSGELTSMAAAPAVVPRRYRARPALDVRDTWARKRPAGHQERRVSWRSVGLAGLGTPERALEERGAGVEQGGDVGLRLVELAVVEELPASPRPEGGGVHPAEPARRLGLVERMEPRRPSGRVEADRRRRRCVAPRPPASPHVPNV